MKADYYLEHPRIPESEDEPLILSRSVSSQPIEKIDKIPTQNMKSTKVLPKKPVKQQVKKKSIGKKIAVIERMNRARASSVSDTTFDDSTNESFTKTTNNRFRPKKRPLSPANNSMDYAEASSDFSDAIMVTEYDPPPTTSNADDHLDDFSEVSIVESDYHMESAVNESVVSPMEVDKSSVQPAAERSVMPKNPWNWSVENFCDYLKMNDLGDCVEAFRQARIDGRTVMGLNREQIYGVLDKLGPSLKVSHKVEELKRTFPNDRA